MLKKLFYLFISFFFVASAAASIKKLNFSYPSQSFTKIKNLFDRGHSNFSFDSTKINWYSGRCFVRDNENASPSLLFLLPSDFYKKKSGKGPLFPESERMWILESPGNPTDTFDNLTDKNQKQITKTLLTTKKAPKIEKYDNAFMAKDWDLMEAIVLRKYNEYLIVVKADSYLNFAKEYCYYFKKVK